MDLLQQVHDPRNQSYITYQQHVLLMTRILSAIFYISSMRKASAELNCTVAIENIGTLCGEELEELPYWETINQYLERIKPEELQHIVCKLVKQLIRSKAFENARIREKYWQILIDGTQIFSSRKKLDGNYIFRVHNEGTDKEYTEYCYYVLEAKLVLHDDIVVSIMTEFVENKEEQWEKQDCEWKAAQRLMKRLKETFPRLPICVSADSLYACALFFSACKEYHWRFIIRFKNGSIPSIYMEFLSLCQLEKNRAKGKNKQLIYQYDFVNNIDYEQYKVNYLKYKEEGNPYPFYFLTDLPLTHKNVMQTVFFGRRRWAIENQGFNAQKNHGFFLEHLFSRNCQGMKNHYYLIQIAHMISQIMDAWKKLWEGICQSKEQKHRRILESWKTHRLSEWILETSSRFQIRLE